MVYTKLVFMQTRGNTWFHNIKMMFNHLPQMVVEDSSVIIIIIVVVEIFLRHQRNLRQNIFF
jgi:hypothetical protein